MFSTCSKLTPRSPIRDGRMERLLHQWLTYCKICQIHICVGPVQWIMFKLSTSNRVVCYQWLSEGPWFLKTNQQILKTNQQMVQSMKHRKNCECLHFIERFLWTLRLFELSKLGWVGVSWVNWVSWGKFGEVGKKDCRFAQRLRMWLTHCLWVTGCLPAVVMANGDMQHCTVLAFLTTPRFLNVFV